MKIAKIISVAAMTLAVLFMLISLNSWGSPSYTAGLITCQRFHYTNTDSTILECRWKCDTGAATISAQALPIATAGFLIRVTTAPGGTAPTNLYDIDLDDAWGTDMDGTALDNRSSTATETVDLQAAATPNGVNIHGSPTVTITGNAVNDAEGQIIFYIRGKPMR